ncbi:hypothetical protein KEM54_006530 [Ascosphaera aggregata]|nr:hypothetical protein KEM54_006530 [Ascosphaera aggregata]
MVGSSSSSNNNNNDNNNCGHRYTTLRRGTGPSDESPSTAERALGRLAGPSGAEGNSGAIAAGVHGKTSSHPLPLMDGPDGPVIPLEGVGVVRRDVRSGSVPLTSAKRSAVSSPAINKHARRRLDSPPLFISVPYEYPTEGGVASGSRRFELDIVRAKDVIKESWLGGLVPRRVPVMRAAEPRCDTDTRVTSLFAQAGGVLAEPACGDKSEQRSRPSRRKEKTPSKRGRADSVRERVRQAVPEARKNVLFSWPAWAKTAGLGTWEDAVTEIEILREAVLASRDYARETAEMDEIFGRE